METFSTIIDEMWDYWKLLFLKVVGDHAPLVTVRMKKESAEWVDGDIHKYVRARNYYQIKHRKTRADMNWQSFKHLRSTVRRLIRQARVAHYITECQNIARQEGLETAKLCTWTKTG